MSEHHPLHEQKMRISFDLDEVLFVSPLDHKTEPELRYPLNKIYKERVRLGAPQLINDLQRLGYEVWVYTSSFRTERYIRRLFRWYNIHFDGIINAQRHLKEVQQGRNEAMPQKVPTHYRISLHVDDESVVVTYGKIYGFNVYQLDAQDDEWAQKIIQRAEEIRSRH